MLKKLLFTLSLVAATAWAEAAPPKVGDRAPDFELRTLAGEKLKLGELTAHESVVVVMLRGWPGYQCPICTRQVGQYLAAAPKFAEQKARVLMIYPGPARELEAHAKEFQGAKEWPAHFSFLTDPDYRVTQLYGLRWDAPGETAYPSTLVIDRKGVVRFIKVSHTHGDRTSPNEVLAALKASSEP